MIFMAHKNSSATLQNYYLPLLFKTNVANEYIRMQRMKQIMCIIIIAVTQLKFSLLKNLVCSSNKEAALVWISSLVHPCSFFSIVGYFNNNKKGTGRGTYIAPISLANISLVNLSRDLINICSHMRYSKCSLQRHLD
jgi:hypothetical protein